MNALQKPPGQKTEESASLDSMRKGARLGQHFLNAPWAAEALADAADITKADTVLEIGPGRGALTTTLLKRAGRVIAIEKDEALAEHLQATYARELESGALTIVGGDIRDVTPTSLGLSPHSYILAANIPYYITGEIIRQFLAADAQPKTMALLVQKEVGERIARSKKESILSLSVKVFGTPRLEKTVTRGNFSPPPSVDSAILSITRISRDAFQDVSEEQFFLVVRAGFAAKRKLLSSNLKKIADAEKIVHAFNKCGLPLRVRAEDVPLEKWISLTKQLLEKTS